MNSYVDNLAVGIIQTTVDSELAWLNSADRPQMTAAQDSHVWMEILNALRSLQECEEEAKLILLPELSLPRTRLDEFARIIARMNTIAVVGSDYRTNDVKMSVKNEGIVFVPRNFYKYHPSRYCTRIPFGKTHPAPKEMDKLAALRPPWSFESDVNVYVFDAKKYGKFGVSICWDFMDIERALMYRGQVQHLFVIAYNKDIKMFRSLATSLSRTVFCNVVVCNTGYFGGSLIISPYYEEPKRTLYAHEGSHLFTTQVVKLPVKNILLAQRNVRTDPRFKDPPPCSVRGRRLIHRQL